MKKILAIICLTCLVTMLSGCTVRQSYTYELETGDKLKISIDTADKINITPQIPFSIMRDRETTLSRGTFIEASHYDDVVELAKENGEVVDSGEKDNYEYIMVYYNEESYDCFIKIKDCKAAIVLSNSNSKEEALDMLKRLSFKLEK